MLGIILRVKWFNMDLALKRNMKYGGGTNDMTFLTVFRIQSKIEDLF